MDKIIDRAWEIVTDRWQRRIKLAEQEGRGPAANSWRALAVREPQLRGRVRQRLRECGQYAVIAEQVRHGLADYAAVHYTVDLIDRILPLAMLP